jgi:hypothetical protein
MPRFKIELSTIVYVEADTIAEAETLALQYVHDDLDVEDVRTVVTKDVRN